MKECAWIRMRPSPSIRVLGLGLLCTGVLQSAAEPAHQPQPVRGGVRSSLYPDDWKPGFKDSQGRFLQDYSYAGYHNGEKPLPTGHHSRTFDVTAPPYGADTTGTRDSSGAIQKAIDDAESAGAGIVYMPAGTYTLSDRLHVKRSRIVLRGAGSQNDA